jgi:hypothetical protein
MYVVGAVGALAQRGWSKGCLWGLLVLRIRNLSSTQLTDLSLQIYAAIRYNALNLRGDLKCISDA